MRNLIGFWSLLLVAFGAGAATPTASLTVTVEGSGQVVSAPAGIACPDDCNQAFKRNSTITLVASPASGATFLGWSGACAGTAQQCVIARLNAAKTVTSTFSTLSASPPGRLAATGVTKCYDAAGEIACSGTGQDGETRAGLTATPRLLKNADGTVLDRVTGLVWTPKSCAVLAWNAAASYVANLKSGDCQLNDGSKAGDWRLPNALELQSLLDWQTGANHGCVIQDANGTFCLTQQTWSSTPGRGDLGTMFHLDFSTAQLTPLPINISLNVLAVKK